MPIPYRSHTIRIDRRKKRPFLIFNDFNIYQPVAHAISMPHAKAWVDKFWAKRAPKAVA